MLLLFSFILVGLLLRKHGASKPAKHLKSDAGSPVRSCVAAYRLDTLGSAVSHSADFAAEIPHTCVYGI